MALTLTSLETKFTGLHFRCWQYGSICIQGGGLRKTGM